MMFQKKIFFKNKKKSVWDFQLGTSLPSPPSKKKVALKKSLMLHTRGGPAAAAERVYWFFWFFFLSLKFLIWPAGLPRRRSSPKIAARWRYGLPSDNLTAHYDSQFFGSFHFGFDQEAQNAFKRLWIGPKHNSAHFKSLCWCLLIDRWSCVHPVYAGKRL